MKTLKFRVYDTRNKTMIYFTWKDMMDSILSADYVYYHPPDNINTLMDVVDYIDTLICPREDEQLLIMQYVGQSDMNGRDIYEDDIIYKEIYAPDDPIYGHYGPIGVIERDEHSMGWYVRTLDVGNYSFYDYMGSNFTFDDILIAGNIHENPEFTE